ncbi:2OG-Fe(II) oxygenase [Microbulbifer sp. VTAC004]|uniref:2OG-Fe(II) oxygenase n=1 Tax=Microbulbifer sp. VTAC004 TaxID=3243386 RepID=UPI00403970E2
MANGPVLFKYLFLPEECADIVCVLEDLPGWRFAGAECGDTRVNNLPDKHAVTKVLAQRIEQLIHDTWKFTKHSVRFSEAAIVRYCLGAVVPPHSDTNRTKRLRAYSFVVYLTDNYQGGELIIPSLSFHCSGKLGHVVVFPSTEVHYATAVIDGDKSVLVGFLEMATHS